MASRRDEGDDASNAPPERRRRGRDPLRDLAVLYRGDGFAVLAKPAGVAVAPERHAPRERALLARGERLLGVEHLTLVHRIDKGTSGCLLVAWDPDAHRVLSAGFRDRTVDKAYLALVAGVPAPTSGVIEARLESAPSGSRMRIAPKGKGTSGRRRFSAETRFRSLLTFRSCSLVVAKPVTGRQHQIRLHLRHVGAPLLVDPLYASADGLLLSSLKPKYKVSGRRDESPLIARLTLHAWKLSFTDPSGKRVSVRCPLPKDFARALAALVRFDRPKAVTS